MILPALFFHEIRARQSSAHFLAGNARLFPPSSYFTGSKIIFDKPILSVNKIRLSNVTFGLSLSIM